MMKTMTMNCKREAKMSKTIITLGVVLMLAVSVHADGKAKKLLNDVEKVYEQMENVCADFTQTFYWKLTDERQNISGHLCAKGGDRFRIETAEQLIVTDGKTLWTKNKANNQVIIDYAENAASENPFIKDFIGTYLRDYNAEPDEAQSTGNLRCVLLTAKTDDQFVRRLRLWINEKSKLILKIEQLDINENTTTFELENIDLNAQLVNKDFTFKPAAGDNIVDMR